MPKRPAPDDKWNGSSLFLDRRAAGKRPDRAATDQEQTMAPSDPSGRRSATIRDTIASPGFAGTAPWTISVMGNCPFPALYLPASSVAPAQVDRGCEDIRGTAAVSPHALPALRKRSRSGAPFRRSARSRPIRRGFGALLWGTITCARYCRLPNCAPGPVDCSELTEDRATRTWPVAAARPIRKRKGSARIAGVVGGAIRAHRQPPRSGRRLPPAPRHEILAARLEAPNIGRSSRRPGASSNRRRRARHSTSAPRQRPALIAAEHRARRLARGRREIPRPPSPIR